MLGVVLVDDSAPLRRRVAALLEELPGVRVLGEADTPATAVALIQATAPDVVVLDLRLRDGVGLDVLQQIRVLGCRARVLVFTNHPADVFRDVYTAAGADGFYDKARDSDQLVQQIAAMAAPPDRSSAS